MNEVANFIKGQYLPDGKEGCFENELNYPPYCPSTCINFIGISFENKMSRDMTKPTKWLCAQRRLRSAWASAQSDQSLRCPHEETLDP